MTVNTFKILMTFHLKAVMVQVFTFLASTQAQTLSWTVLNWNAICNGYNKTGIYTIFPTITVYCKKNPIPVGRSKVRLEK
jgi:hypothetical protein